jgi:hypothetical protein
MAIHRRLLVAKLCSMTALVLLFHLLTFPITSYVPKRLISPELWPIFRYICSPPIFFVLTAMFFRGGPIRDWFLSLYVVIWFLIPEIYFSTCGYITIYIMNRPDEFPGVVKGLVIWLAVCLLFLLISLIPRNCPNCKNRSLIVASSIWTDDVDRELGTPRRKEWAIINCSCSNREAARGYCMRCKAFFA